MNKELLDAIRIILKTELDPIKHRLDEIEKRLDTNETEMVNIKAFMHGLEKHIDIRFDEQTERASALLEGWTIQKIHRRELDDHEIRITTVEHRIPAIS